MLHYSPLLFIFAPARRKIAGRVVPTVNDSRATEAQRLGIVPSLCHIKTLFIIILNYGKVLYISRLDAGVLQKGPPCSTG